MPPLKQVRPIWWLLIPGEQEEIEDERMSAGHTASLQLRVAVAFGACLVEGRQKGTTIDRKRNSSAYKYQLTEGSTVHQRPI